MSATSQELSARMREALIGLGIGEVIVVGDADIALYGATEGAPGLIVIAGTGSICCGINARGKQMFFEFSGDNWVGLHLGMSGCLTRA